MRNEDTVASSFCFLAVASHCRWAQKWVEINFKNHSELLPSQCLFPPREQMRRGGAQKEQIGAGAACLCGGCVRGVSRGSCPRHRGWVAGTPLLALLRLRWVPPSAVLTWSSITDGRGNSSGTDTCTERPRRCPRWHGDVPVAAHGPVLFQKTQNKHFQSARNCRCFVCR